MCVLFSGESIRVMTSTIRSILERTRYELSKEAFLNALEMEKNPFQALDSHIVEADACFVYFFLW
jgi:hypothetical protein